MKTLFNKVCAIVLIFMGVLSIKIENDITVLLFFSMIGIPLFFAKENWMY